MRARFDEHDSRVPYRNSTPSTTAGEDAPLSRRSVVFYRGS